MQFHVLISRAELASPPALRKEDTEAEAEFVRQLYADGFVRQIWLRAEGGAAMIVEADSKENVGQVLSGLPLVKSGYLAEPQISQLRAYAGFGPRAK